MAAMGGDAAAGHADVPVEGVGGDAERAVARGGGGAGGGGGGGGGLNCTALMPALRSPEVVTVTEEIPTTVAPSAEMPMLSSPWVETAWLLIPTAPAEARP